MAVILLDSPILAAGWVRFAIVCADHWACIVKAVAIGTVAHRGATCRHRPGSCVAIDADITVINVTNAAKRLHFVI